MEWLPIAIFILLGLVLIIVEIIFVPGTTVVGIMGFLSMAYGIFLSYASFGNTVGTGTLIGTLIVSVVLLYWSFRNKSWERFSLKSTVSAKVNEDFPFKPEVGDKGISVSALRPIGKAAFGEHEIEVSSHGGFIDENSKIEVLRIEGSKIIVTPI